MHLDYKYKQLIINNCKEIFVSIKVILIKNKINRIIQNFIIIIILSHSSTITLVYLREDT